MQHLISRSLVPTDWELRIKSPKWSSIVSQGCVGFKNLACKRIAPRCVM